MSRSTAFVSVALVMFAATPLFAQQPAQQQAQPAPRGAAASATAMASVEAINQTTREVTLRKEDGELVSLVVSEEARNLSQVEKGDRVVVTYEVGLVVALGQPGSTPARVEETEVGRAPLGAKPGGSIKQTDAVDCDGRRDRSGRAEGHVEGAAADHRAARRGGPRLEQDQDRRFGRRGIPGIVGAGGRAGPALEPA